jgi:hypothetical protein
MYWQPNVMRVGRAATGRSGTTILEQQALNERAAIREGE